MPACTQSLAADQSAQSARRSLAGLEVAGLVECLEALLELALAVHDRCATSTTALLDMLAAGLRLSGTPEWDASLPHQTLDQGILAEMQSIMESSGQAALRAPPATVAGEGDDEEAEDHCATAAFGPWLAEYLKCFHEWMDTKMDKQLHTEVSQQHNSAFLIASPRSAPLLRA